MSKELLYWILLLFWLMAGAWWGYKTPAGDRGPLVGWSLLLFLLFLVIGWSLFGQPIKN